MTRTLSLIGGNGDNIRLDQKPFLVHNETVSLGSPEEQTRLRETIRGRRSNGSKTLSTRASFEILVDTTSVTEARDAMRRIAAALAGEVWLVIDHGDEQPVALVGRNQITPFSPLDAPDRDIFAFPVEIEAVDDPFYVTIRPTVRTVSIGVDSSTPWTGWTPSNSPNVASNGNFPSNGYFIADAGSQILDLTPDPVGVDVWPEWTIKGPATSFELVNLRTGKMIAWESVTLGASDVVKIVTDPNNVTVELNGVDAYADLALRTQLFPLRPDLNPIRLALAGGTSGQSSIAVSWHDRRRAP